MSLIALARDVTAHPSGFTRYLFPWHGVSRSRPHPPLRLDNRPVFLEHGVAMDFEGYEAHSHLKLLAYLPASRHRSPSNYPTQLTFGANPAHPHPRLRVISTPGTTSTGTSSAGIRNAHPLLGSPPARTCERRYPGRPDSDLDRLFTLIPFHGSGPNGLRIWPPYLCIRAYSTGQLGTRIFRINNSAIRLALRLIRLRGERGRIFVERRYSVPQTCTTMCATTVVLELPMTLASGDCAVQPQFPSSRHNIISVDSQQVIHRLD
ncbi:hypothetical protein B0H13DRAFT_2360228 [Mycena leptocephala]|nr:hypothetical protein B0H13DRAFT_2360228 [Mycena leptocephala]